MKKVSTKDCCLICGRNVSKNNKCRSCNNFLDWYSKLEDNLLRKPIKYSSPTKKESYNSEKTKWFTFDEVGQWERFNEGNVDFIMSETYMTHKEYNEYKNMKQMKEKLRITLKSWDWECGDGCCHLYGTTLSLNGKEAESEYTGDSVEQALKFVLRELGYEVEITHE